MGTNTTLLCALLIGMLAWSSVCPAQDYEFKGGFPTPETARRVQERPGLPARYPGVPPQDAPSAPGGAADGGSHIHSVEQAEFLKMLFHQICELE
jgi:hypothetical protein